MFLEAEQFASYGGWVLDQQFMDQMGSPYLLAHGLATPVDDATTTFTVNKACPYRVWVRTFDWTAPWYTSAPEEAPGRFSLLINDTPVSTIFGTKGADWHWQDGGVIDLSAGECRLTLHDLTGCEGRCDAILFSDDLSFTPPHEKEELAAFRRTQLGLPETPDDGGNFDLVVIGAGIAGMCAAVSAARRGLSVALVNDRLLPGGANTSEILVNADGKTCLEPFEHVGELVEEFAPQPGTLELPEDGRSATTQDLRKQELLANEPNLTYFGAQRMIHCKTSGGKIAAVVTQDIRSARQTRITGSFFVDCTGDGDLGYLAGADHDMTLTGHMGPTNVWQAYDTSAPAPFPRCPWAIDLHDKPFPGRGEHVGQWGTLGLGSLGRWFWESGFDMNPITEAERIRDTNLRAMYGAWDTLKNVDNLYPTHALQWAAYVMGRRESRRLFGDVIINRGDLFRERKYQDACVPCTWHMDLHVPHKEYQKGFEGEEFISWCMIAPFPAPFWLPYRALYSRNITNLFMAGRNISVTHEALGGVRVQRTTGMMGEVVGAAASLCKLHGTTPRGIYENHLEELLSELKRGGIARPKAGVRPDNDAKRLQ